MSALQGLIRRFAHLNRPIGVAPDATERSTSAAAHPPAGASRGQVIVLFALFLVGLMGLLGLAMDMGYAFAAKRAVQGAADAGAIAGARQIARYTTSSPTRALPDVTTIVSANVFSGITPTVTSCEYITDSSSSVGDCGATVPSTATGTRVRTRASFPTFFIQVVPGAPNSITVAGYAAARVQRATGFSTDGPFIVCGINAWDVTSNPNGKNTSAGTNSNILTSPSFPANINQNAVGRIFRIHDPQLDSKGNADCSSQADRFKGLADQDKNGNETAPAWLNYDTGNKSGPTRTKVNGAQGCSANANEPYNCVMILPIATNNPPETGNSKQIYVLGWAAFYVTTVDSNSHNGQLMDDFIMSGPGTNGWCRDCGGVVVIRLVL